MQFWLEVTSAAGVRTGRIDNVLYWRWTPRLDKAGEIEFAIPAADPKRDLLTNKVRVTCYAIAAGAVTEMGAGIVEQTSVQWSPSGGPVLTVRGGDLLRELAIHRTIYGVNSTLVEYSNTLLAPDLLIDLAISPTFPASWTLGGESSTDTAVYLRIWHDSILNGLIQVASVTGEHFRLGSGRTLTWLGPVANFADSGILATTHGDPVAIEANPNACLITNITEIRDSWDQWTIVHIYGAGEGESRLDLRSVENWPEGLTDFFGGTSTMTFSSDLAATTGGVWNCHRVESYLKNITAATAYGNLSRAVIFKNIAPLSNTDADLADAADQLLRAGYHYARTRATPQRFYRLTVTALETIIDVGETIRVMARGVYEDESGRRMWLDVDESLIVLEVENEISASGVRTLGLIVSTVDRWPDTDQSAVMEPLAQVSAALSLPQLSANLDTVTFEQPVDDDYSANVHFWLGPSVTTVNQVVLRFRVDPLRSTVKTVAGSSTTTAGGSAHTHTMPVYGVADPTSNPLARIVYVEADNDRFVAATGAGSDNAATNASESTHTHSVTPNVDTTYGIFEESGGNTYTYSDLEFEVNGSAASGTPAAISGASGWYELDLTADLVDEKSRPNQAANYVTIAIKAASQAGKTVRVTGEIERRTNIQSIASV